MKLSDRLQYIADEVRIGETMADIGTDHGFLPLYLWQTGKSPHVIMSDISKGSLEKAEGNCTEYFPGEPFDLRLGSGIEVLGNGETDVVVIAGMGGLLMTEILNNDLEKSRSFRRLILQPRNNIGRLRFWLLSNGFEIVKEGLVREGRFICEIITVEPDLNPKSKFSIDSYGPEFDFPEGLLEIDSPLIKEYLERKLKQEQKINNRILTMGNNAEDDAAESMGKIKQLEELLNKLEINNEKK